MTRVRLIRGSILNPRADGSVDFHADGLIAADERGVITWIGEAASGPVELPGRGDIRRSDCLIVPPFLDAHTHISQHPIRGRFMEGVPSSPPDGPLLAGLRRNVFPAELRCADPGIARQVVRQFLADTLVHGVVGGAAYMTVHADATRIALEELPATWSVGLVLMNQNCPEELRTDQATLKRDVEALAGDFGRRFIVTDRFAVAVDSALRRRAAELAQRNGLRMQTHLNEQAREKMLVEQTLYPHAGSYTNVYRRDRLLDREPILAHCVRMRAEEFDVVAGSRGAAIAHCPTSNALLGSGIMGLDEVAKWTIPYAICTDVGASPTVSLLAEMAQFLKVHADRSRYATPQAALAGVTVAPARILGLERELGTLEVGKPLSFLEVAPAAPVEPGTADDVIVRALLGRSSLDVSPSLRSALDRLERDGLEPGPELAILEADARRTAAAQLGRIRRIVLHGEVVFER